MLVLPLLSSPMIMILNEHLRLLNLVHNLANKDAIVVRHILSDPMSCFVEASV